MSHESLWIFSETVLVLVSILVSDGNILLTSLRRVHHNVMLFRQVQRRQSFFRPVLL